MAPFPAVWIAVHHDTPAMLPFDSWSLLQEIGAALMLRFDQQQRLETVEMITRLRKIENQFSAALRQNGDFEDVLVNLVPILQGFLGADGFAFQYGSNPHVSGRTPPTQFVRELITWAIQQRETSDQFQTSKLHEQLASARAHIETACGVLIQPIAMQRVCQLI
ncbi:MAG: hypothetical protein AB8B51_06220 [Sedimentitalea sp.]